MGGKKFIGRPCFMRRLNFAKWRVSLNQNLAKFLKFKETTTFAIIRKEERALKLTCTSVSEIFRFLFYPFKVRDL